MRRYRINQAHRYFPEPRVSRRDRMEIALYLLGMLAIGIGLAVAWNAGVGR